MPENVKPSLIIATYNWKDALELVLKSILEQNLKPFEVIIADDGSREDTKELIDRYREKFDIPLRHIWHEDNGFRLSQIRNKSIKEAQGNYIIQIDGDTILHQDFVKDHVRFAKKGQFISGSRVLLCEPYSKKVLQTKTFEFNLFSSPVKNKHYHLRMPILAKFLAKPNKDVQKVIRSVRGCNMSFWKSDLMAVNGYNEDMVGWGREDSELAARLVNLGLSKINLRFSAIQYHIYHPVSSKNNLSNNDKKLAETLALKKTFIPNGIVKTKQTALSNDTIQKLTAVVPTLNEAENIEQVIDNLRFADEILIIDSFSKDNTVELASQKNVRVIQRNFDDFSTQKNFALQQAKYDWIFILDADERISEGLQFEIIEKLSQKHPYDGFWIPRKNYFLNKEVKYSGWQNDKVLRLFNKNTCRYNGKLVHEEIECMGKVGQLKSSINHHTYKNYDDYLKKIKNYSRLKALELYKKNIRPNFFYLYIKPAYRFAYHYLITFGFLDGKTGFTIAKINAIGMRERYRKLKELYKQNKNRA